MIRTAMTQIAATQLYPLRPVAKMNRRSLKDDPNECNRRADWPLSSEDVSEEIRAWI
jgi:hypothetical protein